MKIYQILFLLFCHASLAVTFATDKVRYNDLTNFVATGFTNKTFSLTAESPSGDGATETAPGRVYLPVKNSLSNLNYSTLSLSGVASLFDISSTSHYVSVPLSLTVGATEKYIYLAVRGGASGSEYFVSARSTSKYSNVTNSSQSFSFSPRDICKSVIINNISTVCNAGSGALDPTSITNVLYKPLLYFFLSDEPLAIDGSSQIVPSNANYSNGVFLEAQMSNRIFDAASFIVSLNALRKGDGRLIGDFSANATMDSAIFKKVIVYQYTNATTPILTNSPLGTASAGSILDKDISTNQSGEFTLSGLTNSTPYKISIGFEDKFLFSTALSTSQAGTPTEIQELLKKQACYLLTAGFGEEHYVINYFRHYRDHVLAQNLLGRLFIKLYYFSAPAMAQFIYHSDLLRAGIRAVGYILFFIFNIPNYLLLLFVVVILGAILRKNKILFGSFRL